MGLTVTPIKVSLHWDDLLKLWHLKASRTEEDATGTKPWVDEIIDFITLAEAILALLQYFAPPGSTVTAPVGDLAAFGTAAGALAGSFTQGTSPDFPSDAVPAGPDFETPPYDGSGDSWGASVGP